MRVRWMVIPLAAAMLVWLGCPTAPAAQPTGDATRGRAVFEAKGCGSCHTLPGVPSATGTTGPPLNGIASTAGTRKSGMSAADYIRESEQNPNAFTVPGF